MGIQKRYVNRTISIDENLQEYCKIVGERIKSLRSVKNHTKKQLADILKLGKSGSQKISNVERGARSISAEYLPLIAELYGTYVETFFIEDKNMLFDFNMFAHLVEQLGKNDVEKDYSMQYINYMYKEAVKRHGTEKLFDIIYEVLRLCSYMSDIDSKFIEQELNIVTRHHQQTDKSLHFENAVMSGKDLFGYDFSNDWRNDDN